MLPVAAGLCAGNTVADWVIGVGFIGYGGGVGVIGGCELVDVVVIVAGEPLLALDLIDVADMVELYG